MRNRPLNVDFEDIHGETEIAITDAAMPEPRQTIRERLEECLLGHGIFPTPSLLDSIEDVCTDQSFVLAGESVRYLLRKLHRTPAARALMAVVLGDGDSLESMAVEVGTSKQNLDYHVKKIRAKLKSI